LWFTKVKRAQNVDDFETWQEGGVMPTLNAMDNNGEAFATALILIEEGKPVIMRNREGCAGGGKGLMYSDKSFTLATSNDQFLIIDGTRVDDVRVYEDGIVPTVISRYGTGGGNVPMVFEPKSAFEENLAESDVKNALRANASKSSHAVVAAFSAGNSSQSYGIAFTEEGTPPIRSGNSGTNQVPTLLNDSVVRRLTPTECERLQGFPDNWTDGQADSNRYKQMGNAVAVPVVQWIIDRMVAE
jgi:site-specific DNA-cytosine methylase